MEITVWADCLCVDVLEIVAGHPVVFCVFLAFCAGGAHDGVEGYLCFVALGDCVIYNTVFAGFGLFSFYFGIAVMHSNGKKPKIISNIHLHIKRPNLRRLNIKLKLRIISQSSRILKLTFLKRIIIKSIPKLWRRLITFPNGNQNIPSIINISH